jgi:hypothetical protein
MVNVEAVRWLVEATKGSARSSALRGRRHCIGQQG